MRTRHLPILLMAFALCLTGCTTPQGESKRETGKDYAVKTIDGCEYIEFDYGIFDQRVYSLTHKGDCKNPIHHCNAAITK